MNFRAKTKLKKKEVKTFEIYELSRIKSRFYFAKTTKKAKTLKLKSEYLATYLNLFSQNSECECQIAQPSTLLYLKSYWCPKFDSYAMQTLEIRVE